MPRRTLVASFVCLGSMLLALAPRAAAELSVGDPAPDFELHGSDGKLYRLADLIGEGGRDGIVLAWFPKAFTGG